MKKHLLAIALIVAFAAPSIAGGVGDNYYVVLMLQEPGKCGVMTKVDETKHKMMGQFKTEAEAKAAMASMKECGG